MYRLCRCNENQCNCDKQLNNTSGYKGVYRGYNNKWRPRIRVKGKLLHLGDFDNLIDAAKAYNEAAIKYHGNYARPNKI